MHEALAIQAEAWAQEELHAQRELLALLERQERAIRAGSTEEIVATTAELDRGLARTPARDARRRALLARMEASSVAPRDDRAKPATLGALCAILEAHGVDVSRLRQRREELRGAVAEVVRAGRRLAAIARYHGGLLEELCAALVRRETPSEEGVLVDAEA